MGCGINGAPYGCGESGKNRYNPTGPIFISYRQSDGTALAEKLDRFLRAGGLVPWRDLVDLPPGETARRVHEAFDEGISAAVLIVTPEIDKSQFIPDVELPALLDEERQPHDFSLLILNTIEVQDQQAEGPAAASPSGSRAALDFAAPDQKLKTQRHPLKDLKHYAVDELRQLYHDLLHRRLTHLTGSYMSSPLLAGLPFEIVSALRIGAEMLFGGRPANGPGMRGPGIGDGEVTIQTQTRPVPDAHTRRSGTTTLGREHDLAIRLRQDPTTGIPAAEDYRHFKDTLPIMVDALYAHGVSSVTLTGGGHYSLGWALGAALPITRQGGLSVIDLIGDEWTDIRSDDDCETFHAVAEGDQQDLSRLRRVAVLIRNSNEQNQAPFTDLKATCDDGFEIVIQGDGGHIYPANEGARLARKIAGLLREHGAGKELHIAWSAATALAPLVARRTNTLNCVLYELTQNPFAHTQHYQKVMRVVAGMPHGPVVEVFDDQCAPSEPPETLINLTPHTVRLYRDGEVVMEWPAAGEEHWVRVGEERSSAPSARHDDLVVPVTVVTPSGLCNEPPEVPGTGYIVSRLSAQASSRGDYFFPLDEVRDENGNILGVKGLGQFAATIGD